MSFEKRLSEVRKMRGFSQEELAERIGTKGPAIGRYERGTARPSFEVALRLADALDISLDYLVGKVDTTLDTDTLKRIQEIEQLDEDDRSFILRALDGLVRDLKTQRAYAR
ncbi:MAG: helix-turn-helix transcriptional regulator [Bacteroidota bacterium]